MLTYLADWQRIFQELYPHRCLHWHGCFHSVELDGLAVAVHMHVTPWPTIDKHTTCHMVSPLTYSYVCNQPYAFRHVMCMVGPLTYSHVCRCTHEALRASSLRQAIRHGLRAVPTLQPYSRVAIAWLALCLLPYTAGGLCPSPL